MTDDATDATDQAAEDEATGDEPGPTEAPDPAPARPPALVLAISLAVVFGLAAAVLGVVAAASRGDGGEPKGLADLRRAAGVAAEAFLTYDYQHLDEHEARLLRLSTGSFRRDYDESFEEGLGAFIVEVQASSRGFVKDVYVSTIEESRAEAIIRSDITVTGVRGDRVIPDIYMLLSFVRVDGRWLVDGVSDLKLDVVPPGAGGSADGEGTTTSTSAPVP